MKRSNRFHNSIIFSGPAEELSELAKLIEDSGLGPSALPDAEVARHLAWFKQEIGCTCELGPGHITQGWTFGSPSAPAPTEPPPAIPVLARIRDIAASRGVTTQYIGIDTQRKPHSVGLADCSHCHASILGSIGNNRHAYLQVLQHVFNNIDTAKLLKELTIYETIGPPAHRHGVQWSDTISPLRLGFNSGDPARKDLGLSFHSPQTPGHDIIVRGGFLPPDGDTLNVKVGWRRAYLLLQRARENGVDVRFDEDAVLIISGYALFHAGVIDSCAQLVVGPSPLGSSPDGVSEERARLYVMQYYVRSLTSLIGAVTGRTQAIARDHLKLALAWLRTTMGQN